MTNVEVGSAKYLTCAETAKLVRKALAKAFPDYAFSVRSSVYSGGASIDVDWYDGPPAKVVDAVVRGFRGGGFDGMIDMAFNVESWLEPDGTAHVAGSPGTQSSRGMFPEVVADPRTPDAQLVSFGADFVFTNRHLTPEAQAVVDRKVRERFRTPDTDYELSLRTHEVASRWLFPPCRFTYSVTTLDGTVEAEGFTSKSAAEKRGRELQKARNPRGFRYVRTHREG